MNDQGSVTLLFHELSAGDGPDMEAAAAAMFERYGDRLIDLARQQISQRFRQRMDEDDIAQSVMKSFFARARSGKVAIEDRDDLWSWLVTLTLNKIRRAITHHEAEKRKIQKEETRVSPRALERGRLLGSVQPTAEDALELAESLDRRLRALGDPGLAQIALMKLDGYSNNEIARKIGRSPRTVERKLEIIRLRWKKWEAG